MGCTGESGEGEARGVWRLASSWRQGQSVGPRQPPCTSLSVSFCGGLTDTRQQRPRRERAMDNFLVFPIASRQTEGGSSDDACPRTARAVQPQDPAATAIYSRSSRAARTTPVWPQGGACRLCMHTPGRVHTRDGRGVTDDAAVQRVADTAKKSVQLHTRPCSHWATPCRSAAVARAQPQFPASQEQVSATHHSLSQSGQGC